MSEPTIWEQPNTAFPERGGYARSDRADDYQPARATVRAGTFTGSAVEQAAAAMEHANKAHAKYLDSLAGERHRYSAGGYLEQAALFGSTDAAKAVDNAVTLVETRVAEAETAVKNIRKNLTKAGDAAQESRNTRYWDRTQAVLEAAGDKRFGRAQQLIKDPDLTPEQLGVLLEELPAYLETHGITTDWMDPLLHQVVPEYATAKQKLSVANQALIVTKRNARTLQQSFRDGHPVNAAAIARAHAYDPDNPQNITRKSAQYSR